MKTNHTNRWIAGLASGALMLTVAVAAFAQGPGGGGRGFGPGMGQGRGPIAGGPGGGGGFGAGMGRGRLGAGGPGAGLQARLGIADAVAIPVLLSPEVRDELKLTDDQVAKLKTIQYDQEKAMIEHRAQMQTAQLELEQLLDPAQTPDRAKIMDQIDKLGKLRTEAEKQRVGDLLTIRETLTADQLNRVEKLRADRRAAGPRGPQGSAVAGDVGAPAPGPVGMRGGRRGGAGMGQGFGPGAGMGRGAAGMGRGAGYGRGFGRGAGFGGPANAPAPPAPPTPES